MEGVKRIMHQNVEDDVNVDDDVNEDGDVDADDDGDDDDVTTFLVQVVRWKGVQSKIPKAMNYHHRRQLVACLRWTVSHNFYLLAYAFMLLISNSNFIKFFSVIKHLQNVMFFPSFVAGDFVTWLAGSVLLGPAHVENLKS